MLHTMADTHPPSFKWLYRIRRSFVFATTATNPSLDAEDITTASNGSILMIEAPHPQRFNDCAWLAASLPEEPPN